MNLGNSQMPKEFTLPYREPNGSFLLGFLNGTKTHCLIVYATLNMSTWTIAPMDT